MYIIGNILVSDAVADERFACDIAACKGACCWEGEYGAPLEADELPVLEEIFPQVAPYLSPQGAQAINRQGLYTVNHEQGTYDTPLVNGAACAYMSLDERGAARCGIEQAYRDGKTTWRKPISCHLYPIRVRSKPEANFEALNYDVWDICSAACTRGERERIRVYEFAKAALVRRYGQAWYDELDQAVRHGEGGE